MGLNTTSLHTMLVCMVIPKTALERLEARGLNSSPDESVAKSLVRATEKRILASTEFAELPDAQKREKSATYTVKINLKLAEQREQSRSAQLASNDKRHTKNRYLKEVVLEMAPKFAGQDEDCHTWKELLADLRNPVYMGEEIAAQLRAIKNTTIKAWLKGKVPESFSKAGRRRKN